MLEKRFILSWSRYSKQTRLLSLLFSCWVINLNIFLLFKSIGTTLDWGIPLPFARSVTCLLCQLFTNSVGALTPLWQWVCLWYKVCHAVLYTNELVSLLTHQIVNLFWHTIIKVDIKCVIFDTLFRFI